MESYNGWVNSVRCHILIWSIIAGLVCLGFALLGKKMDDDNYKRFYKAAIWSIAIGLVLFFLFRFLILDY